MEFKVINPPLQISIDEYQEQLDRYTDKVKQVPGVRTVLTMGSVNAPGLSDLDVICVVDDSFNPVFASELSVADLRKDIFIHGPVIIHEKFLDDFQYIVWADNINYVWGEKNLPRAFVQYSLDEQVSLATAYLVDFSESRLAQYAYVDHVKIFDKRGWMTRLWSLTHTKKLCDIAEINLSSQTLDVIEEVRKSRSDWLQNRLWNDDELINLFHRSKEVYQEVILKVIYKNYAIAPVPQHKFVFQKDNKQVVCLKNSDKFQVNYSEFKFGNKSRSYWRIVCPNMYATHLASYGFQSQPIVQGHTKENIFLKKRSKLIFESNNFIKDNFLGISVMIGYMGLSVTRHKALKDKIFEKIDQIYWACQENIS